jgi:hypothetical protein
MFTVDTVDPRKHALERMAQRNIDLLEIVAVLNTGDTIEDYPTTTPLPSRLTLGFVNGRPLHVYWAMGEDGKAYVFTAYQPDLGRWLPGFRERRQK